MRDAELLQQVLEITNPWQVVRVRDDLGERRIDVWVGEQGARSGWFFSSKPVVAEGPEEVWQHLNLGQSQCFVHVPVASALARGGQPWCGEREIPFTRALARQVATLLWEGINLQTICVLLGIRVDDLWKFKHSLDNGKTGLSPGHAAAPVAVSPPASAVPDPNDPVWERLLDGSINIDIRVLSLKLLMTRLRDQMRVISDSEVRRLKTYEMHRYFVRYEQTLGHELAQLHKS